MFLNLAEEEEGLDGDLLAGRVSVVPYGTSAGQWFWSIRAYGRHPGFVGPMTRTGREMTKEAAKRSCESAYLKASAIDPHNFDVGQCTIVNWKLLA